MKNEADGLTNGKVQSISRGFTCRAALKRFGLSLVGLALVNAVSAPTSAPAQIMVTTDADSGQGSLREAVDMANSTPGYDFISFAIPGTGPFTIHLLSALPFIYKGPVEIDGYTQAGAMPNSLAVGDDAQIMIELDGSMIPYWANGLVITNGSDGSVIRGLAINGFGIGAGIVLASSSNRVEGCFLGTDAFGTNALPNTNGILVWGLLAGYNQIGGTDPASRNLVSGNLGAGLRILGGWATNTLVQGNYIGTDTTGHKGLGNGGPGILIGPYGGQNTQVGGTNPGEANVIAFNFGSGVTVWDDGNPDYYRSDQNAILGNSIFANSDLGIDLTRTFDGVHGDGPTFNDSLDPDTGANEFQNCPVVIYACNVGGDYVLMKGNLHSTPLQTYRIEFFGNSLINTHGLAQGEFFLTSTNVTTDPLGNSGDFYVYVHTNGMACYSATATDPFGNTSEFSLCSTGIPCGDTPTNRPVLSAAGGPSGAEIICQWSDSGFVLQTADDLEGIWANLTVGTLVGTNYDAHFEAHLPIVGLKQFFRLSALPPCPILPPAMIVPQQKAQPSDSRAPTRSSK